MSEEMSRFTTNFANLIQVQSVASLPVQSSFAGALVSFAHVLTTIAYPSSELSVSNTHYFSDLSVQFPLALENQSILFQLPINQVIAETEGKPFAWAGLWFEVTTNLSDVVTSLFNQLQQAINKLSAWEQPQHCSSVVQTVMALLPNRIPNPLNETIINGLRQNEEGNKSIFQPIALISLEVPVHNQPTDQFTPPRNLSQSLVKTLQLIDSSVSYQNLKQSILDVFTQTQGNNTALTQQTQQHVIKDVRRSLLDVFTQTQIDSRSLIQYDSRQSLSEVFAYRQQTQQRVMQEDLKRSLTTTSTSHQVAASNLNQAILDSTSLELPGSFAMLSVHASRPSGSEPSESYALGTQLAQTPQKSVANSLPNSKTNTNTTSETSTASPITFNGGIHVQITAQTIDSDHAEETARVIANQVLREVQRLTEQDRFRRGLTTRN